MSLKIAVCVKPVPDSQFYDKITINPATKTWNRNGIPMVISDLDKHAIEAALALRDEHGGKVVMFSMAPENVKPTLMEALAMGVDEAVLLSDRAFAGADTLATSNTLAAGIRHTDDFDLVLLGNESDDGSTAQVASQLGEWLEMPHFMNVADIKYDDNKITVERLFENRKIVYAVELPAVVAVNRKINKPRFANVMGMLKAKNKPFTVYGRNDIPVNPDFVGLKGSPTQPGDINAPDMKRKAQPINGSPNEIADKIIDEIKKAGIIIHI